MTDEKKNIPVSDRLRAVAAMVEGNTTLADVGTDHGYVPILLLCEKRIAHAVAMDINSGPLEHARANMKKYRCTDLLELRLSDGLQKLLPGEADSIVIAGMGGQLMIRILSAGSRTAKAARELILQPQSDIGLVRAYLLSHDFIITKENMLIDDGKYYVMMRAVRGHEGHSYAPEELLYGRALLGAQHPVAKSYIEKELRILNSIHENLSEQTSEGAKHRLEEVQEAIDAVKKALAYFDADRSETDEGE